MPDGWRICSALDIGYNRNAMDSNPPLFIIGDIHGYLDKLVRHLRYAGLATGDGQWIGGDAQLWFMGDFTDRGPDGVGVIDLVMRLQQDAAQKGEAWRTAGEPRHRNTFGIPFSSCARAGSAASSTPIG